MPRRSSRLTNSPTALSPPSPDVRSKKVKVEESDEDEEEHATTRHEESGDEPEEEVYEFNGMQYDTYQDMVQAKRQRNQEVLQASGLLEMTAKARQPQTKQQGGASQRGLKRRKSNDNDSKGETNNTARRKSNRIQGIASDGLFVEDERAGRFTIANHDGRASNHVNDGGGNDDKTSPSKQPEFFRGRLNDGSDMTLPEVLTQHVGAKWATDDAVSRGQALFSEISKAITTGHETVASAAAAFTKTSSTPKIKRSSPRSVVKSKSPDDDDDLDNHNDDKEPRLPPSALLDSLSVNNPNQVAKVVPDRIYGMAVHPAMDKLLVCAGDKTGYIGLWNVPNDDDGNGNEKMDNDSNDIHLFKYHAGAAASLQWTSDGRSLFSTSYDGTCRVLDVTTETVRGVFATYDESDQTYSNTPGYGLDGGYHYYTQFGCLDRRHEDCFFVSTSFGDVYHIDSRVAGRAALTWQHELSEKKINSISLHPNGYSLATGGLDCQVYLWDVRTLGGGKANTQRPKPVASYHGGKSINAAFFSPSGRTLVATTMNSKLDFLDDFHLSTTPTKGNNVVKPTHSLRHDNLTGRWLTTFQAAWHPVYDILGHGSMARPRVAEIFDGTTGEHRQRRRAIGGDALTAVVSRLAFHPRTDRIILTGGNSSGRVTIVQ